MNPIRPESTLVADDSGDPEPEGGDTTPRMPIRNAAGEETNVGGDVTPRRRMRDANGNEVQSDEEIEMLNREDGLSRRKATR